MKAFHRGLLFIGLDGKGDMTTHMGWERLRKFEEEEEASDQ